MTTTPNRRKVEARESMRRHIAQRTKSLHHIGEALDPALLNACATIVMYDLPHHRFGQHPIYQPAVLLDQALDSHLQKCLGLPDSSNFAADASSPPSLAEERQLDQNRCALLDALRPLAREIADIGYNGQLHDIPQIAKDALRVIFAEMARLARQESRLKACGKKFEEAERLLRGDRPLESSIDAVIACHNSRIVWRGLRLNLAQHTRAA